MFGGVSVDDLFDDPLPPTSTPHMSVLELAGASPMRNDTHKQSAWSSFPEKGPSAGRHAVDVIHAGGASFVGHTPTRRRRRVVRDVSSGDDGLGIPESPTVGGVQPPELPATPKSSQSPAYSPQSRQHVFPQSPPRETQSLDLELSAKELLDAVSEANGDPAPRAVAPRPLTGISSASGASDLVGASESGSWPGTRSNQAPPTPTVTLSVDAIDPQLMGATIGGTPPIEAKTLLTSSKPAVQAKKTAITCSPTAVRASDAVIADMPSRSNKPQDEIDQPSRAFASLRAEALLLESRARNTLDRLGVLANASSEAAIPGELAEALGRARLAHDAASTAIVLADAVALTSPSEQAQHLAHSSSPVSPSPPPPPPPPQQQHHQSAHLNTSPRNAHDSPNHHPISPGIHHPISPGMHHPTLPGIHHPVSPGLTIAATTPLIQSSPNSLVGSRISPRDAAVTALVSRVEALAAAVAIRDAELQTLRASAAVREVAILQSSQALVPSPARTASPHTPPKQQRAASPEVLISGSHSKGLVSLAKTQQIRDAAPFWVSPGHLTSPSHRADGNTAVTPSPLDKYTQPSSAHMQHQTEDRARSLTDADASGVDDDDDGSASLIEVPGASLTLGDILRQATGDSLATDSHSSTPARTKSVRFHSSALTRPSDTLFDGTHSPPSPTEFTAALEDSEDSTVRRQEPARQSRRQRPSPAPLQPDDWDMLRAAAQARGDGKGPPVVRVSLKAASGLRLWEH